MKALVFGVEPEPVDRPDTDNPLLQMLARTPVALIDVDDPPFLRPDWVVIRPRITGICGSDSKQVFFDWGDMSADNPMLPFSSFPQILGHEVVADVVALGPEAAPPEQGGVEVGDRVVLNPWLSCEPRGVSPICPACERGDLSLCWNFTAPPIAAGIHSGTSKDATGGWAELMPAHPSMLFKVPDSVPDDIAVFADPFAVSLHSITRHPPPAGGRVLVYGAGALGSCAVAILRALHPDVEVGVIARFGAQADLAAKLGAHRVFPHEPVADVLEQAAEWSGGVLNRQLGVSLPMAHPGGIDVVYDTISKKDSHELAVRLLKDHGTLVKSGVHGQASWEWTPLYFKEISWVGSNAFGIETVEGVRKHGIQHYLDLVAAGRVDLGAMLTHTFALDDWRAAFEVLATQEQSGAIKVALQP
jgi:threonine dehydrogenase-like Zn-dependent dehydrogenase